MTKGRASNRSWRFRVGELSLLCNLETSDNLGEYSSNLSSADITEISHDGVWTFFVIPHKEQIIRGALYRKRLILTVNSPHSTDSLGAAIEWALPAIRKLEEQAEALAHLLCGASLRAVRRYPVILTGPMKSSLFSSKFDRWIDDGMTSFYVRVYDSTASKLGYVRVSRHLAVFVGLSEKMTQDAMNLIYERFLYRDGPIDSKAVFLFFDALNQYVLPLEVNLYIQKIFYALAIFAAIASAMVPLFGKLWDQLASNAWDLGVQIPGLSKAFTLSVLSPVLEALTLAIVLIETWAIVRGFLKRIEFR